MSKSQITLEKTNILSKVDDRLFSSFIEHLGRAVYDGIFEESNPASDEQGFRKDVISLVKELNVPLVRYPGGNFLSGYRWTDGIGPKENRPKRLDLAWHSIEPNTFGIHEFYDWCQKAGSGIMGAVNMGTGTPQQAGDFLEYCNFPGGTYLSDLRKQNGHAKPFGIKTWCVGNEMDGPWQICHLEAEEYGRKARETAKIMRLIDDSVELVVCGSASSAMPTFPEWDRTVLEYTYDEMDYISLHRYYENYGNNEDFIASFVDMNNFIKSVTATADYVKSLKRSKKTMNLSFDEWNVWYQKQQKPHPWQTAPEILEDRYSLLDALVVGGLGITLLNNSDRVKIACLAQLVNVIAPIITQKGGKAIKQSTFWPFKDISVYGRGTAITPIIKTSEHETIYGETPQITAAAVLNDDADKKTCTLFVLNTAFATKNDGDDILEIDLRSLGNTKMISHTALYGDDLHAKNTFENPDIIKPVSLTTTKGENGKYAIKLQNPSWNVIRFQVE